MTLKRSPKIIIPKKFTITLLFAEKTIFLNIKIIGKMKKEDIKVKQMTKEQEKQSAMLSQQILLKDKYRQSLKMVTQMDIQELAKVHPDWCTKDVLVYIVKDYNPDLPSQILIEMTEFITSEWDKIKTKQFVAA
jgi:hypothetical protein